MVTTTRKKNKKKLRNRNKKLKLKKRGRKKGKRMIKGKLLFFSQPFKINEKRTAYSCPPHDSIKGTKLWFLFINILRFLFKRAYNWPLLLR